MSEHLVISFPNGVNLACKSHPDKFKFIINPHNWDIFLISLCDKTVARDFVDDCHSFAYYHPESFEIKQEFNKNNIYFYYK